MNSEEHTLIDGLFSRLQQAETDAAPRDVQAEARIKEHLARQPAAGYFMTQAILVQEAAIKSLDEQNKQLARQIEQLQAQLQSSTRQSAAPASGGFLSSLFGGSSAAPSATVQAPSANSGWREPGRPTSGSPPVQQGVAAAPAQPPYAGRQAVGGGFLGGALKTAAGVAGGVMLAQGISSLFQHHQQPEVVEVIKEEPAQVNDQSGDGGWGDNPQVADNPDFSDTDDSTFFGGDDDSYV